VGWRSDLGEGVVPGAAIGNAAVIEHSFTLIERLMSDAGVASVALATGTSGTRPCGRVDMTRRPRLFGPIAWNLPTGGARRLKWRHLLVVAGVGIILPTFGPATQADAQGVSTHTKTSSAALLRSSLEARLAIDHPEALAPRGRALSAELGTVASAFRNPIAPTVNVGGNPTDVAVDEATHTAYVTNGNDNTVSVVDTAHCRAGNTSGCNQVAPTVAVGVGPVSDVLDTTTSTVYVTDTGTDTVSMIDAATCNAMTASGCSHVPTVIVGYGSDYADVDTANHSVYVADAGDNAVSVVDATTCNAMVQIGCGHVSTVALPGAPTGLAVDEAVQSVYVAVTFGLVVPGSVAMINAATCNANTTTGCSHSPLAAPGGINPGWVAVDPSTHTVYVAGGPAGAAPTSLGSVDVLDDATCNATHAGGCRTKPVAVTVGSQPIGVAVDPITNSIFVPNQEDSTVSVIDGTICNAADTDGCNQHPPTVAVGFSPGTLAVDPATDTVYVPNQDENTVSVLNGAACTLTHQSGCRHAAPTTTVGSGPAGVAVDGATDTIYVTSQNDHDLSVINGATCNAAVRLACGGTWPTVATGNFPQAVAVDQLTHTVYVANLGVNTVSVINAATCDATNHSGCGQTPATVAVGGGPFDLAVNEVTDTIYVADINVNTVSVINGITCNATDHSGCGETPPTISVGSGPADLAVDETTNTVYVVNSNDNTVSVVNAGTCDSTNHSGCGQSPPTVAAGIGPGPITVNHATHTVYVADGFFTGAPSTTVSVIDGATCNAGVTSGCGQTPATMITGGEPFAVAVDQNSDSVYVSSIIDSDVDVFNGATCNASVTSGCAQTPVSIPTGGWSSGLGVNQETQTVYGSDNTGGEVSYFRAR
jgi:YVTN family beta-propeller protein